MLESTKQEVVTVTINEGPDGARLEGIPAEVWSRFKENAKVQFPSVGDDAWASFLSEAILAVAGGTTGNDPVRTYFLTDIPAANFEALHKRLASASLKFEELHGRLLVSAMVPNALRIIAFNDPGKQVMEQNPGIFIVTGVTPEAFTKFEDSNRRSDGTPISFEQLMAAFFNAAMNGTVKLTNTDPVPKDIPHDTAIAA